MTIALDANVILRLVLRDDEAHWRAANGLFAREDIYIASGIWLEVEWVMRSVYELGVSDFLMAARHVIGLPNVETADRRSLIQALDWHEQGMDFADAFHLASSGSARRFATFDRDFRNRGNSLQQAIEIFTP